MNKRSESLAIIRRELRIAGPAAAAQATRDAFEAGGLDRLDLPEVFLAVKAESARFLDQLSGRPPGAFRFPVGA